MLKIWSNSFLYFECTVASLSGFCEWFIEGKILGSESKEHQDSDKQDLSYRNEKAYREILGNQEKQRKS